MQFAERRGTYGSLTCLGGFESTEEQGTPVRQDEFRIRALKLARLAGLEISMSCLGWTSRFVVGSVQGRHGVYATVCFGE